MVNSGLAGNPVPWGWAVCHAGGWVYRRHHYVWCVGAKRHHLEPVRWVKSEHKVGFVPIHPFDVKGRPPINRKEQVFAVNNKNGLSLERVKFDPGHTIDVLKSPPREFRNAYLHPLQRADAPRMEAHAMKEPLTGNKGTVAKVINAPIRFDSKSQTFMMSKEVTHGGKSVTVSRAYLEPWRHSPARGEAALLVGDGYSSGGGSWHGAGGGGSGGEFPWRRWQAEAEAAALVAAPTEAAVEAPAAVQAAVVRGWRAAIASSINSLQMASACDRVKSLVLI